MLCVEPLCCGQAGHATSALLHLAPDQLEPALHAHSRDFVPRMLYENVRPRKQAPTFALEHEHSAKGRSAAPSTSSSNLSSSSSS